MQKKAAVDIGSNSIRYLGHNGERRLITTRLAENIISTGKLSDAAIERSIAALKELAALAAAQDAKPYAYATSAVRDAKFGSRERFLALAGEIMPVRVLSGEEEATFARIGAGIADKPDWGLIDLGGGSCQLIRRDLRSARRWAASARRTYAIRNRTGRTNPCARPCSRRAKGCSAFPA